MPTPEVDSPDEEDLKIHGPIRRNRNLLLGVLAVLIAGPFFTQFLKTYRGIVLENATEQTLVAFSTVPPAWIDRVQAQPGDILEKHRGSWGPVVVPRADTDHELVALFDRYTLEYAGIIKEIQPPNRPGGPSTAVIQLDDGSTKHLPLWAEHLAAAAPGRRVKKASGGWDPVLVEGGPSAEREGGLLAPDPPKEQP